MHKCVFGVRSYLLVIIDKVKKNPSEFNDLSVYLGSVPRVLTGMCRSSSLRYIPSFIFCENKHAEE